MVHEYSSLTRRFFAGIWCAQVRVRRVDFWRADLEKEKTRFFLVRQDDCT